MWSTLAKTWHLVKWHDCCILQAGCWWHKMQRVCTRGLVWPLLCLIDLLRQWQWANYTWNIPRVTSNNSWRQLWLASFTQPICVSFKPDTQVARWRWKRKRGWPFNQSLSQCHAIERETFQQIRSLFHPFTVIPPTLSLSLSSCKRSTIHDTRLLFDRNRANAGWVPVLFKSWVPALVFLLAWSHNNWSFGGL